MRKMYESRVLIKIIDKSELLQLDYPAVRNIMIEVQENEEFLKEEDLQKLKFSQSFIHRYLTKHDLLYKDTKCEFSPQENLKIIYLPKNTTGYLQPCDQAIFGIFKNRYRQFVSKFLHNQSNLGEEDPKVPETEAICKAVSLLDEIEQNVIQGNGTKFIVISKIIF